MLTLYCWYCRWTASKRWLEWCPTNSWLCHRLWQ